MEYTVQQLAKLAGVSARTLRYYDQIGLLRPVRNKENNYRLYGPVQVDLLQQILFFREMEVPLEEIARILTQPGFDHVEALRRHRENLLEKRRRIDLLLDNVQRSIQDQLDSSQERRSTMQDQDKFLGFKQELVEENERKYGAEIREKYGEDTVEASNRKMMNMTEEEYQQMEADSKRILELLDQAFDQGDPASETARQLAELHRTWLGRTWPQYSPEAHRGLVEMYVADDRFAAYYDRGQPGKAQFLRDAVVSWLEDGGCAEK